MSIPAIPHPPIVDQAEWLAHRKNLLANEKELTKHADRVHAELRRLPMVRIEKDYTFDAADGKRTLLDLFEGRTQLIVYHFMFAPEWEKGCVGCTGFVDALGDLSMLNERNTTFALVSRAPIEKLETYRAERGWNRKWVSSFGRDFNYDFHVSQDESIAPVEYNYKSKEELEAQGMGFFLTGEGHGISVFFRVGDEVFHTYSSYGRGCENLTNSYELLDITPYGRQEDWEESPAGFPQKPTYG